MGAATKHASFMYDIADEVVVRLDGVDAFDLTAGRAVERARLPAWTIAAVTARAEQHARAVYAIRFRDGEATCIAVIDESSIDGLA